MKKRARKSTASRNGSMEKKNWGAVKVVESLAISDNRTAMNIIYKTSIAPPRIMKNLAMLLVSKATLRRSESLT